MASFAREENLRRKRFFLNSSVFYCIMLASGESMMDIFSLHREEYGVEPEIVVRAPGRVVLLRAWRRMQRPLIITVDATSICRILPRTAAPRANERKPPMNNLKYRREVMGREICPRASAVIHGLSFTVVWSAGFLVMRQMPQCAMQRA